jgi:hypothetical protein
MFVDDEIDQSPLNTCVDTTEADMASITHLPLYHRDGIPIFERVRITNLYMSLSFAQCLEKQDGL